MLQFVGAERRKGGGGAALVAPGIGNALEGFEEWWRLWNMPEADIAKLTDGVKSGVLGAEG